MADEAGVSHNKSDKLMACSLNKLDNQKYNKAFKLLCDSYSSIGIKNQGATSMRGAGDSPEMFAKCAQVHVSSLSGQDTDYGT